MAEAPDTWLPRHRMRGLLTEPVGEEVVVLDEDTGEVHCLTGGAAAVWRRCDGSRGLGAIADSAGIDRPTAARVLAELRELELLAPASHHESPRITRRAVAK